MVDRRTGAKKMEMWSAEDEGRPAPDFAAPTDRPAARRPAEAQRRRADDAAGLEASPAARTTPRSTKGSPRAGATANASTEAQSAVESRPTRPSTRRPADPIPSAANRPDSKRAQAGRSDSEDADEVEAEPVESTTEFRWPKQSDEPESDKDGLSADSPLLSRAFRAAK